MTAPLRLPQSDAAPAKPLLALSDIRKSYPTHDGGERVALHGVSLTIGAGETVAVIGLSGSGKSTLAELAAGLDAPCSGVVAFDGVDLAGPHGARARRAIATLGADPDLPQDRTVREIVADRREASAARSAASEIDRLFEMLDLGGDAEAYPRELSDGARRRAALARALAAEPRLLVLDEATSALDPEMEEKFLSSLARSSAELGVSMLLVTHDMTAVTALAPRVVVLDHGLVVEQGGTARLFARPEHAVTRRFAAAATGATLPSFLAGRLLDAPAPGGKALVRLAFEGPGAANPVLTNVARELGFDIGILAGSLGAAGGEPYGVLIVAAPSDEPYFTAVIERVEDAGLGVEVLGFIA